ncbi:MAG: hypothetical protein AB7N76_00060 [Planctomycetota bacterium]
MTSADADESPTRIDGREVLDRWLSSGGKNTAGIFQWTVALLGNQDWWSEPLTSDIFEHVRLIGGWGQQSGGSHKPVDCDDPGSDAAEVQHRWLVAVSYWDSPCRVLIDGNTRAVVLAHHVRRGSPFPGGWEILTLKLRKDNQAHALFVCNAATLFPLWAPPS